MKSIVLDGRKFRLNKDKPISKVLQKKLLSVRNTNEYRSYALNKAKDTLNDGRVRSLLTKHAIRNKFREKDVKSAFKNYANSLTLENKHFEGERGLEMIAHQKNRLRTFLGNNRNMKLNIRAEGLFKKQNVEEDEEEVAETEQSYHLPATRYNISNEEELTDALEDSTRQILLKIQDLEGTKSNLNFQKILSITLHFDKYDPTRADSFIELPRFIKLKKACVNIKNQDNQCFKYCIQSIVYDKINKHHPEEMFHYKNINDDIINWEGVKFPTGNRDIDRFEDR